MPTATTAPSGPSGIAGSWWGQEKWDKPLSTTDFWFYQIVDSGPGLLQLKATKCVDPTTTHEYYTDPVSVNYVNGAIASFTLLDVTHQQARYQVSGATISNAIKMNMTEVDVSSSGSNPGPSHVVLLKGSQDAFQAACGTLPSL